VDILFQSYLTSAPEKGDLLASRSDPITPKKTPGTYWKAVWLDPRVDSDVLEERKTLTPAGNQTIFPRLSSQGLHTVATALFLNVQAKRKL